MGKNETRFFDLVGRLGIRIEKRNFPWLTNKVMPGNEALWRVFSDLGGDLEAMQNKKARHLSPDGFLPDYNCIIEFDERQHFTIFRRQTLDRYPTDISLGFDIDVYRSWCDAHSADALKKGPAGYRKPKPEFPFENGRAAQRALFDSCRDLLPPLFGLRPTVRVAEFQVPSLGKGEAPAEAEVRDALDCILEV